MTGMCYIKNVTTLKLNQTACTGCGRCIEVCPHQVFALEGRKARIDDRDACMECGACAKNCPVNIIAVDAGVGCASGMISEWLQEHNVPGIKSGGRCC